MSYGTGKGCLLRVQNTKMYFYIPVVLQKCDLYTDPMTGNPEQDERNMSKEEYVHSDRQPSIVWFNVY